MFQLEISMDKLDALFQEIGNCALFVASAYKGQYLYMSDAIQKIDGYPAQMHLEGGLEFTQSITHPDDYAYCVKHFVHQMNKVMAPGFDKNEIITATNTYRVKHANGHYVWTSNSYLLWDYEDGKPNKLLGVYREKTEEKNREVFLWHHLVQSIGSSEKLKKLVQEFESLGNDFNPKYLDSETVPLLSVPFGNIAHEHITEREKEVLRLVSKGYSDKQIADQLFISNHTAISHRKNLIQKFGVKNTAELIKVASKCYWL
jgi:DNA-binding CsgD family transcriptional regulator